jgi:hypothetical protein
MLQLIEPFLRKTDSTLVSTLFAANTTAAPIGRDFLAAAIARVLMEVKE